MHDKGAVGGVRSRRQGDPGSRLDSALKRAAREARSDAEREYDEARADVRLRAQRAAGDVKSGDDRPAEEIGGERRHGAEP